MLSKYVPRKLYNALSDEAGDELRPITEQELLAHEQQLADQAGRIETLEGQVGDYDAPGGNNIASNIAILSGKLGNIVKIDHSVTPVTADVVLSPNNQTVHVVNLNGYSILLPNEPIREQVISVVNLGSSIATLIPAIGQKIHSGIPNGGWNLAVEASVILVNDADTWLILSSHGSFTETT